MGCSGVSACLGFALVFLGVVVPLFVVCWAGVAWLFGVCFVFGGFGWCLVVFWGFVLVLEASVFGGCLAVFCGSLFWLFLSFILGWMSSPPSRCTVIEFLL